MKNELKKLKDLAFKTIANFALICGAVSASDYVSFIFWNLFN